MRALKNLYDGHNFGAVLPDGKVCAEISKNFSGVFGAL
jgi:hypothetical protein